MDERPAELVDVDWEDCTTVPSCGRMHPLGGICPKRVARFIVSGHRWEYERLNKAERNFMNEKGLYAVGIIEKHIQDIIEGHETFYMGEGLMRNNSLVGMMWGSVHDSYYHAIKPCEKMTASFYVQSEHQTYIGTRYLPCPKCVISVGEATALIPMEGEHNLFICKGCARGEHGADERSAPSCANDGCDCMCAA